jgi:hypothetical protein
LVLSPIIPSPSEPEGSSMPFQELKYFSGGHFYLTGLNP